MEHRHLLPDEFEQLVDGEEGFGISPLRAHLRSCQECSAEFESRREIAYALDRLAHHSPSPLFAYRVMAQVQVFEPWHVSLRDTVRRFVPRTPAARIAAGTLAASVALVLTIGTVWLAFNVESATLFVQVALARARTGVLDGLSSALQSAFGREALAAVQATGTAGVFVLALALLLAVLLAALGFRAAAVASRRRRA
ncbi:MAG: hypothetical protein ACT4R6_02005 [Gemmatimonadaceae bacterium]